MVNSRKHNQNKSVFPLPIENNKLMNELGKETINIIVKEPNTLITSLKNEYTSLDNLYNMLSNRNTGTFIKIGSCQGILDSYEHAYFINDVCNYMLNYIETEEIEAPKEYTNSLIDDIKEVKYYCIRIRDIFFDIQKLQNKQIDKKGYGGVKTIRKLTLRSGYKDYPKESFENIIRLQETFNKENFK